MQTIAILPMKSFDAAKQRLAALLGGGSRHALAQAMFSDVLAALRRTPGVDEVAVVTADHEAEAAVRGERVLVLPDNADAGQSAAASIGIRHAIAAGFERVLLVPGDTPLLDPVALDGLLSRSAGEGLEAVIVPDRHGTGTSALLIAPPDALEPSFGPGSLERHVTGAKERELRHSVEPIESLGHDVDTPDDLADLAAVLAEQHGVAPRTRGVLRQIERVHPGVLAGFPGTRAGETAVHA